MISGTTVERLEQLNEKSQNTGSSGSQAKVTQTQQRKKKKEKMNMRMAEFIGELDDVEDFLQDTSGFNQKKQNMPPVTNGKKRPLNKISNGNATKESIEPATKGRSRSRERSANKKKKKVEQKLPMVFMRGNKANGKAN